MATGVEILHALTVAVSRYDDAMLYPLASNEDGQTRASSMWQEVVQQSGSIAHDLDTLARIREATTDDVRELAAWLDTVPTAIDSQHAKRARALVALLRAIDGAGEEGE